MAKHFKLAILLLLLVTSHPSHLTVAAAATITGNLRNLFDGNAGGTITFSNTVNPQVIGTTINVGRPVSTNLINGAVTVHLVTGHYTAFAGPYTFDFDVPNDTGTYRLEDLATNLITFTYTNRGVFAVAPGANTTATTNNGLVTISASGGSLANATNNDTVVSNGVISAVYSTQLIPANAVYPAGTFTYYTLTGLTIGRSYFLYFNPSGIDSDVINGDEDLQSSAVFVAQATSVDLYCSSSSGTTPVGHQIYPLVGSFHGSFSGTFAGDVVTASQNGLGFADMMLTRSNLGVSYLGVYDSAITNATPPSTYQLAIVSGGGQTYLLVSGSTTKGDYKHALSFPAGIISVGDPNGNMDTSVNDITFYLGPNLTNGSSDSLLHVQSLATSPNNSGGGFNVDIMGIDPVTGKAKLLDSVGGSFMHTPTNRIAQILPGNAMLVFNNGTSLRGFAICSPGLNAIDSGNGSLAYFDFINRLFRVPILQTGIFQPGDTPYTFTVSGITTTPIGGATYTHNSRTWTVISTSITGTAPTKSGTILMTSQGAPSTSGTLTKVTGTGDASISFSTRAAAGVWVDAFSVNPVTGLTTVGSNLTVSGSATFNSTITGNGSGITSIPESGVTSLTTDLAAKAPLASPTFTGTITGNGSGLTALNGANLTSGTVNSNALDTLTKAQLALAGGGGGPTLAASQTWTGSNTFTGGLATTGLLLNTNATGNYSYQTNGSLTLSNASTQATIILTNNEVQSQHFGGIKVGSGPSIASVGTGAGTGGTADFTADDNPNDSWMRIKVVTGTSPVGNATICSVTYSKAWPTKPKAIARVNFKNMGQGPASVAVDDATISTAGFDIVSGGLALTASTTYYITVQSGR